MDNVLITGADGFIGSHLTDFYLEKNFHVCGLKKPNENLKNLTHYTSNKSIFHTKERIKIFNNYIKIPTTDYNLNLIECDLKDYALLSQIIKKFKPKLILHFGAQSLVIPSWNDPVNTIETNVIGTINIFESLKKSKIDTRIIVACSSAEYGMTTKLNRPLNEEDRLQAIHPYGISKLATELLAKQYYINFGIDVVNLRFFNQTGPRKINDACSDFVRTVAQIELDLIRPIIRVGNLNSYRDITGIKDTLNAIWLASKEGKSGEIYNVCSNRRVQIREILNIALNLSTKNIKVIEKSPDKLRKTDEDIILGDNTKIKSELGWEITQSIEEILKEMFDFWINYYKNHAL
ncbi:MAG: GDP-mannose 4,6-dehydratase [Candidatus Thorarchaeota archaeon]